MDDDYKDLSEFQEEVKIRKDTVTFEELHTSILNLSKQINELMVLFSSAADQMKLEEKQKEEAATHHEITEKLDTILDENKTIATSMVALAEMIQKKSEEPKTFETAQENSKPKPQPSFAPPPPIMPPPFSMSPPQIFSQNQPPPMFNRPIPPPPSATSPQPFAQMQPPPLQNPQSAGIEDLPPPPPGGKTSSNLPSLDLPDLDLPDLDNFPFADEKTQKKGLFGRLKK